jgi:acetyl esterase
MAIRFVVSCLAIALAVSSTIGQESEKKRAKGRKDRATAATAPASAPAEADREAFRGARSEIYRKVGDVELKIYFFMPPDHKPTDKTPAIVFFFGGGWLRGSPVQFVPECKYFASRGMVAATADYRVFDRHKAMVADCVSDAESAIRWVRANAKRLGIDPDRIASSGGSAGGHLAVAVGTLKDFTGEKDSTISFRPNAMIPFNPVVDLAPENGGKHLNLVKRLGADAKDLSPADHIASGLAPTLIFHGKKDKLIPFTTIEAFAEGMRKAGNKCEAVGFEGQGHGFFNYSPQGNKYFDETMRLADKFLASLGWLKGEPTIGAASQLEAASKPN